MQCNHSECKSILGDKLLKRMVDHYQPQATDHSRLANVQKLCLTSSLLLHLHDAVLFYF